MTKIATYTRQENFGLITLDDGKANAFSFEMIKQVNDALDEAEKDGLVLVLTGRDGKFCAGFDLDTMKAGGEGKDRLMKEGFALSYRLMNWATPVLLASTGHALAYGAILLLSCDYRIAEDTNAKLGLNEIAIGVTMPAYGIDLVRDRLALPHQIPALACSVLYSPKEAVNAGYLDKVVAEGTLMEEAAKLAGMLSQIDMTAHAQAKRDLRRAFLDTHKALGA
ncbi:crotonase/enoyl-CoA hydratase family protein [Terasakiella pusilla]|jgi:enoyl-CoA hydratase|uniref:crotonase/enoyl-CoA hydratase family protein n=1 Tax=Terasakiella pusilla TaxID=64973 RepID=UPI003AA7E34A